RLPNTEWSIQEEERVFGGSIARKGKESKQQPKTDDARFAVATNHETLLKAADQVESELVQEANAGDEKTSLEKEEENNGISCSSSSSSDSDSDSDKDDVDPLIASQPSKNVAKADNDSDSSSSDSSSSDSSDEEDAKKEKPKQHGTKRPVEMPTEESRIQQLKEAYQRFDNTEELEEEDDFLMDATDNVEKNVFQKSQAQEMPAWSSMRGDKSKGWQTQRQRPGEFKRRKKTWR
ncbi:MAG: hypothetical protein SGARI_003912, partial [Bacillariaceae sp.]